MLDCSDPVLEIGIQVLNIGVADLGVGRKWHGRIKTMSVLGDALTHRAGKVFKAVSTDPGCPVGRDVGGIDPSNGGHHRKTPGELLAIGSRVASDTTGRPGQIAAAFHCRIGS